MELKKIVYSSLIILILFSNITLLFIPSEINSVHPTSIIQVKQAPVNQNIYLENEDQNAELSFNSEIENTFQLNKSFNSSENSFSIDNSSDWNTNCNFAFSDIRSEKIINGNAETTEILWTDYIPTHYEGNVTRENDPDLGEVISGENSWYFDIKSLNHSTIVGFDDPIDVSSNSVIFSFSYSLLRNSLGTSFDSNICIRLFFQFDIYIFIWFNGNTGVLSNVTGPGGYADLLINDADFDEGINYYSLNVTKLGLELFDQEPDQLRSLAIQTWGENPYEMEFMVDDLSLTGKIDPSEIDLLVNSNPVIGDIGFGSIFLNYNYLPQLDFEITTDYPYIIYWNCNLDIDGIRESTTEISCEFQDMNNIKWIEYTNQTANSPQIDELNILKWVPKNWDVDQIKIDSQLYSYIITDSNLTHNQILIEISSFQEFLEIRYLSENSIENIFISNQYIKHDDSLQINVESEIISDELNLEISNNLKTVIYRNSTLTNLSGSAFLIYKNNNSELPRENYTITVFWRSKYNAGIGLSWFEFTTIPTKIVPNKESYIVNYKQDLQIKIDYIDIEKYLAIDFATVSYDWEGGNGIFIQEVDSKYSVVLSHNVMVGNYSFFIYGSKNGYASTCCEINIEVVLDNISLKINLPSNGLPGEAININSIVLDNQSKPIIAIPLKIRVNEQLLMETYTNESGISSILYQIPINYALDNINISSSVIVNENEVMKKTETITIDLADISRTALIGTPIHLDSYQKTNYVYYKIPIIYPYYGENWQVELPNAIQPNVVTVISDKINITATISDKKISWTKSVREINVNTDYLLIEAFPPEINHSINTNTKGITINIIIITNYLVFNGFEMNLNMESSWQKYDNWTLYKDNLDISSNSELLINDQQFSFKIYSTDSDNEIQLRLEGSLNSLVEITPSAIILGAGTVILTTVSTILLIKRKKPVSLDIQL